MCVCDSVGNYIDIDVNITDGIKIAQASYINKLINKLNLQDVKTIITPSIFTGEHPVINDDSLIEEYRKAVGSLLYVANKSRTDIAFHVDYCSKHQNNPNENDKSNIKTILK